MDLGRWDLRFLPFPIFLFSQILIDRVPGKSWLLANSWGHRDKYDRVSGPNCWDSALPGVIPKSQQSSLYWHPYLF